MIDASDHQYTQIEKVCKLIRELAPRLEEVEGDSKWTANRIVFREPGSPQGFFTYMVGPVAHGKTTFHLMPMYSVPDLQTRFAADLKPFSTGKTSIHFDDFDELPIESIRSIVAEGTQVFAEQQEEMLAKKRKKK
jgi:predicted ATPase